MYNVEMIFNRLKCGAFEECRCDDVCLHTLSYDGDDYDYSRRLHCRYSNEQKNCSIICRTCNMTFSGVSYDYRFNPIWTLSLDGKNYSSRFFKLLKLRIEDDIIYEYTRDDIRYWYDNNKNKCRDLLEFKKMNNCKGGEWLDEELSSFFDELPSCRGSELDSFLASEMPGWLPDIDEKTE